MHQPNNPKISGFSPMLAGRLHAGIAVLAALGFVSVLFSDFIVTPLGGYADQRFLLGILTGVLVVVLVAFLFLTTVSVRRISIPLLPTLALSFAFVGVTALYYEQEYVWVEPGMYAFYFLAIIVSGVSLAGVNASVRYTHNLVLITAVACLVYGLASVNVYLFAIWGGETELTDFIPWGFVNIRYWSHIATWCLPLLPLAVIVGPFKDLRSWRVVVLLGAGMWWWILFLSMGRGSALGVAFGVGLAAFLFGRRVLPWLKVFALYLFSGFVLWLLLSVLIPMVLSDGSVRINEIRVGGSGRLPMFIEAWSMSLQNFPFGMGPQSWLTHEQLTKNYLNQGKFGHPHNMYLMWAAEYGWVLIAALGGVVWQAVRYVLKARAYEIAEGDLGSSGEKVILLAAFTASVSAGLFHAGVSAVFMAPGSMIVGLFVLIGFWAQIIPVEPLPMRLRAKRSGRRVGGIFVLVVLLMTVWGAWMVSVSEYYRDMREDEKSYRESSADGLLPRFWLHGNYPR